MFLTGFDSKPLSVLYVDKKLEYHDLLQAYSRTNRVEKETKPWGIIICYRNLKKNTDDALALFSQSNDTDGILAKSFEYYVQKFNELAIKLKEIAPTPSSVDMIMDEETQKNFVVTFRELSKYLLSLQTFVEFKIERDSIEMSDQEFQDYKSKYFLLYRKAQNEREVVSVLNDVDFCIELMETDRINVAYIMNLIRNIRFNSQQAKNDDIEHIKSELGRSDNLQLHKKIDILRAFLDEVVSGMNGTEDIDVKYNDFENRKKQEEIEAFAKNEHISAELLGDFISEYAFSGVINQGAIRDSLTQPMSLLKKRSLVSKIADFIKSHVEKYSS